MFSVTLGVVVGVVETTLEINYVPEQWNYWLWRP